MEYGETEGNFDIIIVNDDLDSAYRALRSFILATFLRAAPGSPPPPPPPSSSARGAASPSAWDPPSTVLPFSVLLQGQ